MIARRVQIPVNPFIEILKYLLTDVSVAGDKPFCIVVIVSNCIITFT